MTCTKLAAILMVFGSFCLVSGATYTRTSGWCEQGNKTITVGAATSSTNTPVQRSYPTCTVSVYLTGTMTLASLFSTSSGTALANPFNADGNGFWAFFANEGIYDVGFNSGGIPVPFAIGAVNNVNPFFNSNVPGAPLITKDNKLGDVVVNVRDYGAKCDGSTDDTAAINLAITTLTAGGEIQFPLGICVITSAILVPNTTSNNQSYLFVGQGYNSTVIKQTSTTADGFSSNGGNSDYMIIRDMHITGPSSGSGVGIDMVDRCNWWAIQNVLVDHFGSHGIFSANGNTGEINNTISDHNGGHGLMLSQTGNIGSHATTLTAFRATNNTLDGTYAEYLVDLSIGAASTFENNGNCGVTIGQGAGVATIRDSYFEGNANSGICAVSTGGGGSPQNVTISSSYFIGHANSHIHLTNAIGWQIYGNFAQVEIPAKTFITLDVGAVLTIVGYNQNTNTTFLVDNGVATLYMLNDTRANRQMTKDFDVVAGALQSGLTGDGTADSPLETLRASGNSRWLNRVGTKFTEYFQNATRPIIFWNTGVAMSFGTADDNVGTNLRNKLVINPNDVTISNGDSSGQSELVVVATSSQGTTPMADFQVAGNGVQVNSLGDIHLVGNASPPTCDVDHRGDLHYVRQATGIGAADQFWVCAKKADDSYEWKVVTWTP